MIDSRTGNLHYKNAEDKQKIWTGLQISTVFYVYV